MRSISLPLRQPIAPTDDVSASITSLKNDNTTATVKPATETKLYNTTSLAQAKQSLDEKQLLESVKYGATDRVSDGIVPPTARILEGGIWKGFSRSSQCPYQPAGDFGMRRILHQQLARYGVTKHHLTDSLDSHTISSIKSE